MKHGDIEFGTQREIIKIACAEARKKLGFVVRMSGDISRIAELNKKGSVFVLREASFEENGDIAKTLYFDWSGKVKDAQAFAQLLMNYGLAVMVKGEHTAVCIPAQNISCFIRTADGAKLLPKESRYC